MLVLQLIVTKIELIDPVTSCICFEGGIKLTCAWRSVQEKMSEWGVVLLGVTGANCYSSQASI